MINDTNADAVEETVEVTDETNVEATEVADAVDAAEAPASLNIQDLAQLRNIINVASQRGAFKTEEFTVVGATYTKLNDFITSVTAQAAPAEATEEVAEEVVTEE